jgi:glycosyltransferase involved in cell wall biosynthesis
MKVLFLGAILDPSWTGGEPRIAKMLDNAFSAEGINVFKSYFHRNRPRKWSVVNPWVSQSVLQKSVVKAYKQHIKKVKPDIVMTWFDYDISALWASISLGIPTIAQAQILWPVCNLSCLFNEITESPCKGPSKSCGLCLARRAKVIGEIRSTIPYQACLPFTQLSMMKINNIRSKLSLASAIVSDSLFLKQMMGRVGYNTKNVHVIYNGVNLKNIKPVYPNNNKKKVLFLSGQINRQKGIYHFIQLSKKLKPEFPEAEFLWVGQNDVKGRTFTTNGYVKSKQELEKIYQSSYLLLLPSLWPEPMSYTVIEAMAHGKPVVAYNIGANKEAIVHGKTGLLAKWGNVDQLSSHVRTLLLDERLARQMGENARKRAEEMFDVDLMTNDYLSLLRETQHFNV